MIDHTKELWMPIPHNLLIHPYLRDLDATDLGLLLLNMITYWDTHEYTMDESLIPKAAGISEKNWLKRKERVEKAFKFVFPFLSSKLSKYEKMICRNHENGLKNK